MKILFITTVDPSKQGDLLEISILHGLREVLGDNCVDYPKKKIMYHDFSESPKEFLHGRGFSLLTTPINDIPNYLRQNINYDDFDFVIYGDGHMYGEYPEKIGTSEKIWIIDGHDLYGNAKRKIIFNDEEIIGAQFQHCFKRELVEDFINIYPTGFGIPKQRILPLDFTHKTQLFQKTAPSDSLFETIIDVGGGFSHHKFTVESDYYNDLKTSWFGLTCKKGGWDCLRHYEILAAGSLLLFKDYDKIPEFCSPQNLPCFSYSSQEELYKIMHRLVVDNKPTDEYIQMIEKQRNWLYQYGTTFARANAILIILGEKLNAIGK